MAVANNMSNLINKIERRIGFIPITPKLPKEFNKDAWADVIKSDSMITFSRYYGRKIRFVMNNRTTVKRKENDRWVYYIKDKYLGDNILLGATDIAWEDYSSDNMYIDSMAGASGYFIPNYSGLDDTFETIIDTQIATDINSMYNNNIFLEFEEPNRVILSATGGRTLNIDSYVINILVAHQELATISPTKMQIFESLAQADVANFLYQNLKYYDGLETIFINVDLKLSELESEAAKRPDIIEELKNSYVSASNEAIPYIITVN